MELLKAPTPSTLEVLVPHRIWWAHGRDSAQYRASRNAPKVGYDYVHVHVHVAVDDHSRLAYVEVINTEAGGENQQACAGFLRRAHTWFADHGVSIERILTDNAMAYRRSRLFAATCTELGIARRFTKPRCPWTNGKAERFNRTWPRSGPTPASSTPPPSGSPRYRPGCTATTSTGPTPHSPTTHPPTASTTSAGTTSSLVA